MKKGRYFKWLSLLLSVLIWGGIAQVDAKPPASSLPSIEKKPLEKRLLEKKPIGKQPLQKESARLPEFLWLPTPLVSPLPSKQKPQTSRHKPPHPPYLRGSAPKPIVHVAVPHPSALPTKATQPPVVNVSPTKTAQPPVEIVSPTKTAQPPVEIVSPTKATQPLVAHPTKKTNTPNSIKRTDTTKPAETEMTAKGFEDSMQRCRRLTQENLREELVKLCKESFVGARVNFRRIVEDLWMTHKVKVLMDMEVDNAASKLYGEYRYWTRLKSTFSKHTAKEMAERMARLAFLGQPFRYRIEMLSKDISKDLNKLIQDRVHHSVNQSMECINSFLQSQYHQSMRGIFQAHVRGLLRSVKPDVEVSYAAPSLVQQHQKALAGVGLLISAQVMRVMMNRISQRVASKMANRLGMQIASRIGTKLIPWVGWGLLVWDLWDLAHAKGALPEIQKALKSPKMERQIQHEIVVAMQESFDSNYKVLARSIADTVHGMWDRFQGQFQKVLRLAERDKDFQKVLGYVRGKEQLHLLVQLYDALGEQRLLEVARQGAMLQILENPQISSLLELLRFQPDVTRALLWYQIARRRLPDVLRLEIHKHKNPERMSMQVLDVLLRLEEPALVSKMLLLPNEQIVHFDRVSTVNRKLLIQKFSTPDLRVLAGYLAHLDSDQRNNLVASLLRPEIKEIKVLSDPGVLALLKQERHKDKLLQFFLARQDISDLMALRYLPLQAFVVKYGSQAYLVVGVVALLFLPLAWFLIKSFFWPVFLLLRLFRRKQRTA